MSDEGLGAKAAPSWGNVVDSTKIDRAHPLLSDHSEDVEAGWTDRTSTLISHSTGQSAGRASTQISQSTGQSVELTPVQKASVPPFRTSLQSLRGSVRDPLSASTEAQSRQKSTVDIVVEEREWGAGLGLSDSDSDSDGPVARRKKKQAGTGGSSPSKPKSRSSKSSTSGEVNVVQVSGEWKGMEGMSDSDSSEDDAEERRQKEREKRRGHRTSGESSAQSTGSREKMKHAVAHLPGKHSRTDTADSTRTVGFRTWAKFRKKLIPEITLKQLRFMVVSVLGVLDFSLQICCLVIYYGKDSYVIWVLAPIQLCGAMMSAYITFHDTDVLHFLREAGRTFPRCHKCLILWTCLFFGGCHAIQVKRAWARQLVAAEIITEMGEDDDDDRAATAQSLGAFGGAERAIPVALLTNVPFLLANTLAFLTFQQVWLPKERFVLAAASIVALINVSCGIIEIDLAVSSYVFKRYHLNWKQKGTRAGRLQFLYPFAHVLFRACEVCLRVLFFSTYGWMWKTFFDPKGVGWIVAFFIIDYSVGLVLLKVYSPSQEKLSTHILMAMLMLVADLTHFIDQPNFTVPAQKISSHLSKWRLLNMCGLIFVSYWTTQESNRNMVEQCKDTAMLGEKAAARCDLIVKRGWLFEMNIVVGVFAVYCILRFSRAIRKVGDDLHTTARNGHVERLVKLLQPDKFNQVLDVNAVTKDGQKMTPAMFAAAEGHTEALQRLAEAGADLNMRNIDDESCLHLAAKRDSLNFVETVEYLLKRGAYPHFLNRDGKIAEEICKPGGFAAEFFKKFRERAERRRSLKMASKASTAPSAKARLADSDETQTVAVGLCEAVPLVSCGSVQLRGLFPDADDNDSPSPRALDSVSALVFSRAAGLLARRVLNRGEDNGQVPIGALRRIGELGKGGFGHVIEVELPNQSFGRMWKSSDRANRRFALKLQLKQGSQRSAFCEVLALRTVTHRFIVRLERAFQTPKYFALLLELCPNDLNRMLCDQETDGARCCGISELRTAKYLGQILLALKHLHEMEGGGIVYRDVKPENILISQDDEAKLTDFGLAKVVTSEDRMTMCGTMGFFPPELLNCDLISEIGEETEISVPTEYSNVNDSSLIGSLADRARHRRRSSNANYDAFKLDAYSYGVTMQLTLLGEDGANRKEVRKKGPMMLPMHHSGEENIELLKKLNGEGKLSTEALNLLKDKLLPHRPSERARLGQIEVVNHPFFLTQLGCTDTSSYLMTKAAKDWK